MDCEGAKFSGKWVRNLLARRQAVRALIFAVLCLVLNSQPLKAGGLLVFAAASTTPALSELARMHKAKGGARVRLSFGASSTLARQIAFGAPAHLFVSASRRWMEYLVKRKAVRPDTVTSLVTNRLVLITGEPERVTPMSGGPPLQRLLGKRRLAIADPGHVPAGIYAKAALRNMGLWAELKDRLAPMMDVRATLALVERGEVGAGLVYASDAHANPRVRVVFKFPLESHQPIIYPAALTSAHSNPEAKAFLKFLNSPPAKAVFARFGFSQGTG